MSYGSNIAVKVVGCGRFTKLECLILNHRRLRVSTGSDLPDLLHWRGTRGGDADENGTQEDGRSSRVPSHAWRGRHCCGRRYGAARGQSSRRYREQRREAQGSIPSELTGSPNLLPRQPVSELKEASVLIKRTERQARRGTLASALQDQTGSNLDRRALLRDLSCGARLLSQFANLAR